MTNSWLHYIFHTIAYYVAWFSCMFSAAHNKSWIGIIMTIFMIFLQLFWQYFIAKDRKNLGYYLIIITGCGFLIDSAISASGILIYSDNAFAPVFSPPWILVLWAQFGILVQAVLKKFTAHLLWLSLLCLVGFPLAYVGGARIGAAILVYGWVSSAIIGIIWAIMLPTLMYLIQKKD